MNNRWRQIAKFIKDKHERWDYEAVNKHEPFKCPCCQSKLRTANWYDHGLVETIETCRYCGYESHWSYGLTMLSIGTKWYEEYPHNASEADVARIQTEFSRQINSYRARYKHAKRMMYV